VSISGYIKEIGRGKQNARHLSREQAAALMGQVLDDTVTDLELGAFCLAMRIKGETAEEMAGFLDAAYARIWRVPCADIGKRVVVLPSYNGARRLPLLTPLLAGILAQQGFSVLVHGCASEEGRVTWQQALEPLRARGYKTSDTLTAGYVTVVDTERLHPGLHRLLSVRRVVGLRNSGHSLVKLLLPIDSSGVLVTSYTHPEYLLSMQATMALLGTRGLLLRGTEGEPVADPRRMPAMEVLLDGVVRRVQEAQSGSLTVAPSLPAIDPAATAAWTMAVLSGELTAPLALQAQVHHIEALASA
jgi:anthranilate phosphoribosyltransferase